MNYAELIKETWKKLQDSLANNQFDPKTEADMQCFLYHLLLENLGTPKALASTSHPHGKNKADLVIDGKVFIQNKFILRSGKRSPDRWDLRKRIVEEDIEKLQVLMKDHPARIGVLAILAASYKKKDDEPWYDAVNESCEEKGIIMLRAWKQ